MPARLLTKLVLAASVLAVLACPRGSTADAGRTWSNDFGAPGVDGNVFCATRWRGGIVVGGRFGLAGDIGVQNVAWFHDGRWEELGSGVDGAVFALSSVRDTLVACGAFTRAGGLAANHVARWTGTQWNAMGEGLESDNSRSVGPTCLALFHDQLVALGWFDHSGTTPLRNIARWDGAAWQPLGAGLNSSAFAAAVYHDRLFVAGGFDSAGTDTAPGLAAWDGARWSALPWDAAAAGYVRSLAVAHDRLYAGGLFDLVNGVAMHGLAAWDGVGWSALAGRPAHQVEALAARGDSLYVSELADTLEIWDGSEWHDGGPGPRFSPMQSLFADSIGVVGAGRIGLPDPATGVLLPQLVVAREDGDWHGLESWTPLMHGLDGYGTKVMALTMYEGQLVAGGVFPAGGDGGAWKVLRGLGRWDGTRWHALPGWPPTPRPATTVLLARADTLFAFGEFAVGLVSRRVQPGYRFDGVSWTPLDSLPIVPLAAALYRGAIYVAGASPGPSPAAASGVWRLDGTHWAHIVDVSGTNYVNAHALIVFDDRLVVGGQFTQVGSVPANHVAAWDGTAWAPLGQGPPGGPERVAISSLAVVDGALHAGGAIQGDSISVVRWSGTDWVPVGAMQGYSRALATLDGRLYAAGALSTGGQSLSGLASWDGVSWQTVGGGIKTGAIETLLADGLRLWVGGGFSEAGDVPSYGVALWDSTSVSSGGPPVLSPGVPNPFTSGVDFSYELTTGGPVSVAVTDAAGRRVATLESDVRPPGVHTVHWDGRGEGGRRLSAGMYFVRITRPDGRTATRKAVLLH